MATKRKKKNFHKWSNRHLWNLSSNASIIVNIENIYIRFNQSCDVVSLLGLLFIPNIEMKLVNEMEGKKMISNAEIIAFVVGSSKNRQKKKQKKV